MSSRRIAAALMGAVAVIGLAAPAQAATWHRADADDPSTYTDISSVRVSHTTHRVVVRTNYYKMGGYDVETVFYDTRPHRPGPEFALTVNDLSDFGPTLELWRASGFHATRYEVRCTGLKGTAGAADYWTAVPNHCLAGSGAAPANVRVSVKAHSYVGKAVDWAPSRRHYSPWIKRPGPKPRDPQRRAAQTR